MKVDSSDKGRKNGEFCIFEVKKKRDIYKNKGSEVQKQDRQPNQRWRLFKEENKDIRMRETKKKN